MKNETVASLLCFILSAARVPSPAGISKQERQARVGLGRSGTGRTGGARAGADADTPTVSAAFAGLGVGEVGREGEGEGEGEEGRSNHAETSEVTERLHSSRADIGESADATSEFAPRGRWGITIGRLSSTDGSPKEYTPLRYNHTHKPNLGIHRISKTKRTLRGRARERDRGEGRASEI